MKKFQLLCIPPCFAALCVIAPHASPKPSQITQDEKEKQDQTEENVRNRLKMWLPITIMGYLGLFAPQGFVSDNFETLNALGKTMASSCSLFD